MSEADDAEEPPYDEKSSRSMSMARSRHGIDASRYSKITIDGQSGSEFSKDGISSQISAGRYMMGSFIQVRGK
jgi:hypothetical protein